LNVLIVGPLNIHSSDPGDRSLPESSGEALDISRRRFGKDTTRLEEEIARYILPKARGTFRGQGRAKGGNGERGNGERTKREKPKAHQSQLHPVHP
jgi:hypothetical protein